MDNNKKYLTAYCLYFDKDKCEIIDMPRWYGLSLRGVARIK